MGFRRMTVSQTICLCLVAVASAYDLRTRRIPQVLTLGGAAAGLLFHLAFGGWNAGLASATGWASGIDEATRAELVERFASTFVRAMKPVPAS